MEHGESLRAMQHDSLPKDSDDLHAPHLGKKPAAVPAALKARLASPTASDGELSSFSSAEDEKLAVMAAACKTVIECLGEDPSREGLLKTPMRMAKALLACTAGYSEDAKSVVSDALFECDSRDVVLVRDIDVYSLCEHHMLPFYGKVHIAYTPQGKVLGLSKLARLVDLFSKRLQIQERLTRQIADAVNDAVGAGGVAVMVECCHMCMSMRGVAKQGATTASTCFLGEYASDGQKRLEFLLSVHGPSGMSGSSSSLVGAPSGGSSAGAASQLSCAPTCSGQPAAAQACCVHCAGVR